MPRRLRSGSVLGVGVFVGVLVLGVWALAGGAFAVTDTAADGGGFGFENDTYRVEPPGTAEIDLNATSGGIFRLRIESPGDRFDVEVVVGYPQGTPDDRDPTVFLDTGDVDADDPEEYLSVSIGTIHRITVHENEVEERLPGGRYDVRVSHGGNRAAATLDVTPSVRFDFDSLLNRSDIERNPVRTITGETDFEPGARVQIRVTSTGEDAFRLVNETVVDGNGRFETSIDLSPVPAGASFDIVARHDDVTRARQPIRLFTDLPEPNDGRQTSDGITFAYEGDQLTLEAAPNQTLTGETTLADGAVITIILRSPESHLHVTTAEVDSYGAFDVTVDLGHLDSGDEIIVSALSDRDASGAAPVRLVEPDETGSPNTVKTAMDMQLGEGDGTTSNDDPNLTGGILAITVGVLLSILASGILLGVGRSRTF